MKLFGRQKSDTQIPPELQPYLPQSEGVAPAAGRQRSSTKLAVLFVAILVLIVGGILIYNHTNKNEVTHKPGPSQAVTQDVKEGQSPSKSKTQKSKTPNRKSTSSTSSKPKKKVAAASTSAGQNQTQAQSGQLSNTGPGGIVALFACAVTTGFIFYQVLLRRHVSV